MKLKRHKQFNKDFSKVKLTDEQFVKLTSYIQKTLLKLIKNRDISIETTPTSNIFISYIENLEEHPILKFNPLEDENINTFLCSNNPMIQYTHIFREYEYIV